MANSVKLNAQKGAESAIILAVATLASEAIVQVLKQRGIDIDNIQAQTAIGAVLAGGVAWIRNWVKHRRPCAK
jgi:hypothetical protein